MHLMNNNGTAMKRNIFIMLIMAAAAIAACTKQPAPEEQPIVDKTYTYTITASAEADEPETKSDYDSEGHFKWSDGDAISVLFHNGDVNKFFTLSLVSGAGNASAYFSGEIESGYEIGASDGDAADKKIWALSPASENHAYAAGSNPTFYVQPSVDFSATHFSANIPMYALNEAEGALNFANLASTYKFTVKNIKDGVDKIQFKVYNQTTYALSGSWPIHDELYLKYDWASPGSANSTLTYVSDVTNNQAVFYVSCRYWGTFQPVITITNCATGVDIKTFTASTAQTPNYKNHVWPITLDVSDGNYFAPAVEIDGDYSDWTDVTAFSGYRPNGSANSRIDSWKFTYDGINFYVYLKLISEKITNSRYLYVGFDTDKDESTGGTHGGIAGADKYATIYPAVASSDPIQFIQGADPRSTFNGSSDGTLTVWSVTDSDPAYTNVELCIPRAKLGTDIPSSFNVAVSYNDYNTAYQTITLE